MSIQCFRIFRIGGYLTTDKKFIIPFEKVRKDSYFIPTGESKLSQNHIPVPFTTSDKKYANLNLQANNLFPKSLRCNIVKNVIIKLYKYIAFFFN